MLETEKQFRDNLTYSITSEYGLKDLTVTAVLDIMWYDGLMSRFVEDCLPTSKRSALDEVKDWLYQKIWEQVFDLTFDEFLDKIQFTDKSMRHVELDAYSICDDILNQCIHIFNIDIRQYIEDHIN